MKTTVQADFLERESKGQMSKMIEKELSVCQIEIVASHLVAPDSQKMQMSYEQKRPT
jgi:hypothetical protein